MGDFNFGGDPDPQSGYNGGGGSGGNNDYSGEDWYSDPDFDWGTLPDNYAEEDTDPMGGTGADGNGGDNVSATDGTATGGGGGGGKPDYTEPGSWADVDATDKDNEIADYLWQQSGPYTEGIFSGAYGEGLPSYRDYMQGTGMGTLQDYMGENVQGLNSYFDTFMNNNPAWEQNAQYGQSQLMETLGQYGGSASGGFSGQQAAGLGRYWSDQTADRWSQAAPAAFAQWGADSGYGMSDYDNMFRQNTMDFSNQLSAYNRPYDYTQQLWGGSQQGGYPPGSGQNQGNQGPGTWETVGALAGTGIGAWYGGPIGAGIGGGIGSTIGGWLD